MRICVVTEMYGLGGADTVLAELLEAWPDPADEFIMVSNSYHQRFRPFFDARVGRPVQWLTSPTLDRADLLRRVLGSRWRQPGRLALLLAQYPLFLWNAAKLAKLFQVIRPDVLLINNGGYPGGDTCRAAVLAGVRCGIPRVVMVVHSLAMVPRPGRWLPELLIDRYLDRHAQIVCVSSAVQVSLQKLRSFNQTGTVIPNGFTPRGVPPIPRQNLLSEFDLSPEAFLICIVASYEPLKGHQVLFEAVEALVDRLPHIRVLAFGAGSERDSLRLHRLIEQHHLDGRVIFCGFRQNVIAYVAASDLLILPSVAYESFGMAILEAMAVGTPVIACDVGGVRDLVEDCVTGRLLPAGDVHALAEAIEQAINHTDASRQWADEAYNRYRATYTGEMMARSYHRLMTAGD